jgi:hypothetical protein
MTTLLELAERCEREGPSRELDAEIMCSAGGWWRVDHYSHPFAHRLADGSELHERRPPRVTASLDAAVAFAERALGGVVFWKIVRSSATRYVARVADDIGLGGTPALALVAAALRALAARDGAPKEETPHADA